MVKNIRFILSLPKALLMFSHKPIMVLIDPIANRGLFIFYLVPFSKEKKRIVLHRINLTDAYKVLPHMELIWSGNYFVQYRQTTVLLIRIYSTFRCRYFTYKYLRHMKNTQMLTACGNCAAMTFRFAKLLSLITMPISACLVFSLLKFSNIRFNVCSFSDFIMQNPAICDSPLLYCL